MESTVGRFSFTFAVLVLAGKIVVPKIQDTLDPIVKIPTIQEYPPGMR